MHHTPATPTSPMGWKTIVLTSFVLTLLALFIQGQDNNWDLRNYHLYTPSALMDGRFTDDIAAAQLQTWHNPALDFPFAWMVQVGMPGWVVSLWLALPAFLALVFALRLLDLGWPGTRSHTRTVVAGLVAVSGAAVMPGIGTTFNDAFVAAGMLFALWWIVASQGRRDTWSTWLPAGLIAGAAAGLKLTGALYCIGLAGLAIAAGPWRGMPMRVLALAAGGVIGALLAAGPWALYLWQEHGNPLFPYYNHWFHSPDAMPEAHKDTRFIPKGWDTLLVPYHLLTDSKRFSEVTLADPRMLLGLAALLCSSFLPVEPARRTRRLLLVFAAISFCLWVKLYGIYRYLFALELLCSIAIVGTAATWIPRRFRGILLAGLALLLIGVTNHPRWGRQPFSTPMVDVRMPAFPEDSLVLLANDQPLAYATSFLPRSVPALSIRNNFMQPGSCTRLQVRAEQQIRSHTGPLYLLRQPPARGEQPGKLPYGLLIGKNCLAIESSLHPLELCPLRQKPLVSAKCPVTAAGP